MIAIPPSKKKTPRRAPVFVPGDLVKHRRYGYRGVVVDSDSKCRASDVWYQSNQTQPDKNQPWYHVLVDGSETVTYPAESSLVADDGGQPIVHPLVAEYFDGFEDGRHLRNDLPWPRS